MIFWVFAIFFQLEPTTTSYSTLNIKSHMSKLAVDNERDGTILYLWFQLRSKAESFNWKEIDVYQKKIQ